MLKPAVHCGNDTTHETLEIMCNVQAWHQQCCKSCANGSNIVVLRFSDHRTKEMLGVVGSKFDQFQTLRNNMQQNVQTDRTCTIQ